MSASLDDISDEELESLYASVLDHLLFPVAVKTELIKSQSKEKKRQMVLMHRSAIEKDKLTAWGEKENLILSNLMKTRMPDLKQLNHIKTVLTTANKAVLSSFIDSSGIIVFVKCINDRVARINITELDAVVLYELVSCLKVTMNNEIGMLAVLETPDALGALARCLIFEWKALSTIVLEILSCCCYYSESAAKSVMEGLRQWSITRGEKSFAGLLSVFESEDLSIRYDVMSLINQMIMAIVS
jgi:Diaphanous GTPase-binding Domain